MSAPAMANDTSDVPEPAPVPRSALGQSWGNRPGVMVSEIVTTSRRALEGSSRMATYRMVYGDDEQVVRETFADIDEVEREDGWVVLFRGPEAILRVRQEHVQQMERLDG
jgi:hypothetical protein